LRAVPGPTANARRALLAVPVALALVAAGCGSSDTESSTTAAPSASQFPSPDGKSIEELARSGKQSDLVVAPTDSVFEQGKNRFGFGVFSVNHDPISDAQVALYASQKGQGDVIGPFPASSASLATKPAFRSQTTASDPDAATTVYTTDVDFPTKGQWQILAMIRDDDGNYSVSAVPNCCAVGKPDKIPSVGDKAPVIHTPTAEDVGGDLTKIDTRTPPDTMHDTDLADVLGKEPVVLLFATPALCTSRVCGPVVDIAEEVKSERPDDAAFIHMEIYNNNTIAPGCLDGTRPANQCPRPQVIAYHLPTEPWAFAIDRHGKIVARLEGAFSKDELESALKLAEAK
jgi:hypothetical protein